MQVSIVICCYNSQDRILLTLEHLQSQKTNLSYEIVIVDNNCTDSTIEIAIKYLSSTNLKYKIIEEKKPGVSNARKAGVVSSFGEVVIFCDDDNSLCYNYIDVCYQYLVNNKNIGAMCSASIPKTTNELPIWFYNYQAYYACGVFALNSSDVTSNGWIWSAGMTIRRKVLFDLYNSGFSNILAGRLSNKLSSGEDIEICKWLILCNYRLYYEENIYIEHVIPESRLNKEYIIKF
jgi:glycosyltransferase involved in cell wall biosynthesis